MSDNNDKLKELTNSIKLWNESRLDLFGISLPNTALEFHGIIRFYHQDSTNDGKYATKCVRVSSTEGTLDVIETLAEKFRSDMRMLTKPHYSLYEVHTNGELRKLTDEENPLLVQLGWVDDDREGRFLLKSENDSRPFQIENGLYNESEDTVKGFKITRNLTKKEKKLKKKKEKLNQKSKEESVDSTTPQASSAKQLYSQVPESTFTRTVSNPEAVMKKRREQKLQKRGAEVLKIYGDSINKAIPYKSLLLLPNDTTQTVIRDALDKYGLGKENTEDYTIVQVVLPPGSKPEERFEGGWGKETVLKPDDFPLDIEQNWRPHKGTMMLELRSRYDTNPASEKTSSNAPVTKNEASNKKKMHERQSSVENMKNSHQPRLIELFQGYGDNYKSHSIAPNVTELGSDRRDAIYGSFIELQPVTGLMTCHCVITNMDGVVTVTPHDGVGEMFMDGRLIEETTMLSHGDIIWLGRHKQVVFCDPGHEILMSDVLKKIENTAPPSEDYGDRYNDSMQYLTTGNVDKEIQDTTGNRQKLLNPPINMKPPSTSSSPNIHHKYENRTRSSEKQQQQSLHPQEHPHAVTSAAIYEPYHTSPRTSQLSHTLHLKLPARLNVYDDAEGTVLTDVLSTKSTSLHFKLSPAYSVYLMLRSFIPDYQHKVVSTLRFITNLLRQTMQLNVTSVSELSFWMANTSELLNFLRQDQDLYPLTLPTQDEFATIVQLAFRHLVQCMQRTLFILMPAFLSEYEEDLSGANNIASNQHNRDPDNPTMYDVLHMLTSAMSLLRKCRVNAALTIQLFSQLFHSVNMWLFNKVVASPDSPVLCCREWGIRIRARLSMVESWAEKQGLELAADCHLARITQAAQLLQASKLSDDDVIATSGMCFKLNSLQLRALLSHYRPHWESGERRISPELLEKVVVIAENSTDELVLSDGREITLHEDPDLQLPFLLPEDGYSCDVIHGVPSGLTEFIESFVQQGLCFYDTESISSSHDSWTVFFHSMSAHYQQLQGSIQSTKASNQSTTNKPEIITITYNKQGGGMGLSIVAAKGVGQEQQGIYIRSLIKGGASDMDGRLQAGDQLLSIDGHSLVGIEQATAAELMMKSGQTVTLVVAKQAAVYYGLATLLSQPSPIQQRVIQRRVNTQPRPKSEGFSLQPQTNEPSPLWGNSPRDNHSSHNFQSPQRNKPILRKLEKDTASHKRSTPHLNGNSKHEPVRYAPLNVPRPAMSMGNLQDPSIDSDKIYQKSWKEGLRNPKNKVQFKDIVSQKQRAASSTNLSTLSASEQLFGRPPDGRALSGKKGRLLQSSTLSPLAGERGLKKKQDIFAKKRSSSVSTALRDNTSSNTTLTFDPPNTNSSSKVSLSAHKQPPMSPLMSKEEKTNKSKTLGRNDGTKPKATQKKYQTSQVASKSSTLPRHFKSATPWQHEEQAIQEELNALREEEINELTSKEDKLTLLEQERLKNLLQERQFHACVQEQRLKMFSDEDITEEDFSIPDRPDRDRLIRMQDAQARRDESNLKEAGGEREKKKNEEQKLSKPPSGGEKHQVNFLPTTHVANVIGSQEIYHDPRCKKQAEMKRDESFKRREPDPSHLAFKDRQKLFQD